MHPMDENLIGYLLDALDPATRREVERLLRESPSARERLEQLRDLFAPLEVDCDQEEVPADLSDRTLARLDDLVPGSLPSAPRMRGRQAVPRGWWRRADVMVASLMALVIIGMGGSWLGTTRYRAELTACRDNLRRFHQALVAFANQREDGAFPQVDPQGPRAFAGIFLMSLSDSGLMPEDVSITCPAQGRRAPTIEANQLRTMEQCYQQDREQFEKTVSGLSGCYAYSLGYRGGNGLQGLKPTSGMDFKPIMADCPPFSGKGPGNTGNSAAHQGRGQNVLFVGGDVRYMTSRLVTARDDIFLNKDRLIHAGVDEGDSVLAASDAAP